MFSLTKDSNEPHEEAHDEVHPMGALCDQISITIVTGTGIDIELVPHLTTVPRLKGKIMINYKNSTGNDVICVYL